MNCREGRHGGTALSDFGIDLIRGSSSVIVAQMAAQVTAGTKAGADVNTLSCDIKSRPPSPLRKPLSTDSEIKRQLRQPEDAKDALENGTQEDGKWDIFRAVRGDHGPERHDDHRRRARDDARARAECDVGHTPMTTNDHKPTSGSTPAIAEDAMGLERSEKPTVKPASASAIGFGSATLSSFSTGPPPARTIRARGGTWRWCCAGCAWTRTARGLARCSVGCDHTRTAATKVKESIASSVSARVADALSLLLAHSTIGKQRIIQYCTVQGSPHFCRSEHPVPSELHPFQSRPSGMIKKTSKNAATCSQVAGIEGRQQA